MYQDTDSYNQQSVAESLDALNANTEGLTRVEAGIRLQQDSDNEIQQHEETLWHHLFHRFWGPIPWTIEIAALLSTLVQKWEGFSIILVMLLVNAGLNFFHEHRTLKALKAGMILKVTVLREGKFQRSTALSR